MASDPADADGTGGARCRSPPPRRLANAIERDLTARECRVLGEAMRLLARIAEGRDRER